MRETVRRAPEGRRPYLVECTAVPGPYAVVSCHVDHPLDDRSWPLFAELQERRPSGFRIAALMRPPDRDAGEDEERWLERAREAAARGPLGHHTHFGGPTQARPLGDGDPAARVRAEAAWLREHGVAPRFFCGGGWYIDAGVATAVAELGYVDCTATEVRPRYLAKDAPRFELDSPAWLTFDGGRLLALPTTHSIGRAAGAMLDPQPLRDLVHLYFHDSDLRSRPRRSALLGALALLRRRRAPSDLEQAADELAEIAPEVELSSVSRP
jgi:hypothetical protein